MEELLNGLIGKCGLDQEKAEVVINFLKENASKLPEMLGGDTLEGLKDKLPGGLGGLLGGKN